MPVTFVSADGRELTQDVPIEFRSTHPVNVGSVALVALGLLLLGILLPLVLLWILNWWTTRLDIDNAIQRATFPVRVAPAVSSSLDVPASDTALAERFRYRPRRATCARSTILTSAASAHGCRGSRSTRPSTRYAPAPDVDRRRPARARAQRRRAVRRDDGSLRFRQLPFDAFWAITVTDAELARTAKGDPVNGTAVLYHRFDAYAAGPVSRAG